jgi:tetratricopeptide (TPR) repeat protein
MPSDGVHARLLLAALALTLTLVPPPAFPAPASRADALADLEHARTERRAEAVVWVANHGSMADQPLLLKRLRDESPFVRGYAEQALWVLWSRSGDRDVDVQLGIGVEQMQAGMHGQAAETFSEVIRRRPDFAEGWNKRATVRFLAGEYRASLADCDEVIRRNPFHFGALAGYGQIYFRLGRYEKAIEYWRRALEVNPNLIGVEMGIHGAEERLRQKRGRST